MADPNSLLGIPEPKRAVVLEASYEIESICGLLQRELKRINGEDLALRSLVLRAKALNSVVMSTLTGEELPSVEEIEELVYGVDHS